MRQHISYAVLIAAIAAGLSTQVQGHASEAPVIEQQDPAFAVPPGPRPGRPLLREPPAGTGSPGSLVGRPRQVLEPTSTRIRSNTNCRSTACRGRSPRPTFTSDSTTSTATSWCGCAARRPLPAFGPAGTQACPQSGTITGTITAGERGRDRRRPADPGG